MLESALEMITFFYEGTEMIVELVLSFIPEPFNILIMFFLVMFVILIIFKLVRFAGDLINGLLGVFSW